MNISPPANDLIISAIAIAMAPAASPPANEVPAEIGILSDFSKLRLDTD
jgi:hypothetical protein